MKRVAATDAVYRSLIQNDAAIGATARSGRGSEPGQTRTPISATIAPETRPLRRRTLARPAPPILGGER
ncbi:hypothetical protein [Sphingomonas sp. UYP23]